MTSPLPCASLDQLFRLARTYNELYEVLKWGPTSSNCCPARFVWVRSADGKAKLAALAMEANRSKILAAPITVIIGYDLEFP
jgi:nitroreductase